MKKIDYNRILKLYTDYDPYRQWLSKYYKIDNFAYSTNATSVCQIPLEYVTLELINFNKSQTKTVKNIFNYNKNIEIAITSDLLQKHIKNCYVNKHKKELNKKICKECNGKGKVIWEYDIYEEEFDCPVCEGLGFIETIIEKETDIKIIDDKCYLNINGLNIKATEINKIIEVSKILNENKFNIYIDVNEIKKMIFKFKNIKIAVACQSYILENSITIKI